MPSLSEWSDIAQIFGALVTLIIAILVFAWQKRQSFVDSLRELNSSWNNLNALVVQNDFMATIESENHPYGKLSIDDTKKMYFYFMIVNQGYTAWILNKNELYSSLARIVPRCLRSASDSAQYVKQFLENEALILFNDRKFVTEHVLPRGYSVGFQQEFRDIWANIEKEKTRGAVTPPLAPPTDPVKGPSAT